MNNENVVVREAGEKDIKSMAALLEELFSIEADFECDTQKQAAGLKMLINSSSAAVFVGEFEGQVVGMVTLQILISTAQGSKVGLIEDMVIKEGFRGKGTGGILLRAAEEYSRKLSLTRLQLLADKENTPALEFYEKNGWQNTNLRALRKLL
jgi:ribosomal protein S18 acetylase RimI-like enzyme